MGRKALSLALAVLMIISLVPMTAIATDAVAEEVIYNLGSYEVTVGYDTEQAEIPWASYELFDEDDGYTIILEDNAFFPYEVQFHVDGEAFVEWFETPESIVEVGGHDFSVYSEQNDETKLRQLGFWIDGQYMAVYPEAKEFTNPIFAPMSMLPITVVNLNLDLTGLTMQQLQAVTLSAVYSGASTPITDDPNVAAWVKKSYQTSDDDGFQVAESTDILDLTPVSSYNNYFYLEMIVGTVLQLDTNNIRYIVYVTTDGHLFSDVSLYTQDTVRTEVTDKDAYVYTYDTYTNYQTQVLPDTIDDASAFYVGLTLNSAYNTYTPTIYVGRYESAEAAIAADAEDVTSKLLNDTMSTDDAGYQLVKYTGATSVGQYFTVVMEDGDDSFIEEIRLTVYTNGAGYFNQPGLYYQAIDDSRDYATYSSSGYWYSNYNRTLTYEMDGIYPADAEYYLGLTYYAYANDFTSSVDNTKIEMAVVGSYESKEDATADSAVDIKDQLMVASGTMYTADTGYKANYSGEGVTFTIFVEDGEVYQYTIIATDREWTDEDDSLSRDTYFYVTGASGVSSYTMPYTADSYYYKGYQTVLLLNDTVDLLENIQPTFWNHSLTKIYAPVGYEVGGELKNATEQTSGTSEVDFSKGAMPYTARAQDDEVMKNYNVTFVQQEETATLYVNGPTYDAGSDPEDPIVREIILETDGDYHDIFIANIGKTALTGLSAELSIDAGAVKLDGYWTVGGAGNDTLAGFTSLSYNPDGNGASSSYNEIANVAKIRLVADGSGVIDGKLTISSTNGGSFDIYLTGVAGQPEIITDTVDNPTKYVPHSVMIQTNYYGDMTQAFSLASGSLPAGMTLLPNGEIYGVPTVAGTYTFTASVSFGDGSIFIPATKEFTFTVLENTDANVAAASDHTIDIRVPATITSYTSQVFEVDNVYADFMDFYLDGQKLTEGVHYDSEEGSTKITIRSQTFQNAGTGTHTIAAEFREDADTDKEMTKAAQNYTSNVSSGSYNPGDNSSSTPTMPSTEPVVTVTTPANGTVSVSTTEPKDGDKVTVTVTPQYGYELDELKITDKDGKELDYTNNGDETFTFTYGGSEVEVNATFAMISTGLPFLDVFSPDWYLEAVRYVYENGIMIGVSETDFAPTTPTSRAMMITVLYRIAGEPDASACPFADVPDGTWYTDSVAWAAENGIVSGIGNNLFAPDAEMTREQMAVMLYNFCVHMNIELPDIKDTEITDADQVSSWAIEAVEAMYKAGILNGRGDGVFDPKGTATRAEVAQMLMNFMEAIK